MVAGIPRNGGWIPNSRRNRYQRKLTAQFAEQIGCFSDPDVSQGSVEEPERVILAEIEMAVLGQLLPRIWQQTGSCVGAAAARAYSQAALGDVYFRQDFEAIKIPFPYATYGVGREIAFNGCRPGDGSFGAAQAQACGPDVFGILPWDDERVPKPSISNGWAKWKASEETKWSCPSGWPVRRSALEGDAKQFGLHKVTQAKTVEEIVQALAQGYGVTVASMFGTRRSEVRGDVAIAVWNDQWAHQMSYGGYWKHPQHGLLLLQDNQWGPSPSIHVPCPTLSQFGINGSYWQLASDTSKILNSRDGEVFIHSATGGFPKQGIEWDHGWDDFTVVA